MLAKGSDTKLKSAALKELGGVKDPKDIADLADVWWEVAESQATARAKSEVRRHAASLYQAAIADMPGGLKKRQIEGRLASLGTTAVTRPSGPSAGGVFEARRTRPSPRHAGLGTRRLGEVENLQWIRRS